MVRVQAPMEWNLRCTDTHNRHTDWGRPASVSCSPVRVSNTEGLQRRGQIQWRRWRCERYPVPAGARCIPMRRTTQRGQNIWLKRRMALSGGRRQLWGTTLSHGHQVEVDRHSNELRCHWEMYFMVLSQTAMMSFTSVYVVCQ